MARDVLDERGAVYLASGSTGAAGEALDLGEDLVRYRDGSFHTRSITAPGRGQQSTPILDSDMVAGCSIGDAKCPAPRDRGRRRKEPLVPDVVHTSRMRIDRVKGPIREMFLEGFDTPIRFGVHGGIKKFYGVEPDEDVPATLDYMVGAVGG